MQSLKVFQVIIIFSFEYSFFDSLHFLKINPPQNMAKRKNFTLLYNSNAVRNSFNTSSGSLAPGLGLVTSSSAAASGLSSPPLALASSAAASSAASRSASSISCCCRDSALKDHSGKLLLILDHLEF